MAKFRISGTCRIPDIAQPVYWSGSGPDSKKCQYPQGKDKIFIYATVLGYHTSLKAVHI